MRKDSFKKLTLLVLCIAYICCGAFFSYAETPEPSEEATPVITTAPTPTASPKPTQEPTVEPTSTPGDPVKDHSTTKIEVVANGSILYISDKPDEVEVPDGFVEFTYIYKENLVWAAENKDSGMILMYLESANKEKTGLYAYDKTTEIFTKYINITSSKEIYVILQKPDDVEGPEGFLEKQVVMEGEEITVWVSEAYKYLSPETSEYYIVYAMNPQGEKGFYVFDRIELTFQRFGLDGLYNLNPMKNNTPGPQDVVNPDDVEEDDMWSKVWDSITAYFNRLFSGEAEVGDWVVLGILAFILVLLIIIGIFIVYANRKIKEEKAEEVPLDDKDKKKKRYRKSKLFQDGYNGQNASQYQGYGKNQNQSQGMYYGAPQGQMPPMQGQPQWGQYPPPNPGMYYGGGYVPNPNMAPDPRQNMNQNPYGGYAEDQTGSAVETPNADAVAAEVVAETSNDKTPEITE